MRKVHPSPRKRNIAIRCSDDLSSGRQKRLRRLPHVFSKVLELPFKADADVSVEENSEGLRFVAATDGTWENVKARAIEVFPGATKVVIRDGDVDLEDGLEIDRWRFRLPSYSVPALASAVFVDGELIVTVPSEVRGEVDDDEER